MNYKTVLISIFLFATVSVFAQQEVINFNFDWKFHLGNLGKDMTGISTSKFDDSSWRILDLPHDFQIEQEWTQKGTAARGFKEMSEGWYRKTFQANPEWKGKKILIDFEGIMLYGDAYLNGEKIGGTDYGYLGFEADITKLINYEGNNVVAVYAGTKGNSRWYTGGGLYRDVHIVVKNEITVARNGVYITTPKVSEQSAEIIVNVEIEGFSGKDSNLEILAKIIDPDGKQVGEAKALAPKKSNKQCDEVALPAITIDLPQLWSCETPNLYTAEIILKDGEGKLLDQVTEEFGIRWIEYSKEFGFKLNGKKVFLKGISNHHDLGAVGAAAHEFAIDRMFKKLKEFGFNHIRTSHNPYSKSFLKLADKYGILITDELYDKWSNDDCWAGVERVKWTEAVFQNIPEWIKRDRNHPCVIMWSLGNELQIKESWAGFPTSDWGVTTYRMLDVLVKRYDKTRPTTVAMFPARVGAITKNDPRFNSEIIPPELAVATEIASFNYRWMNYPDYLKHAPDMIIYQSEATTNELAQPFFGMDRERMIGLAYWGAIEYWGESNGWPWKGWHYSFFNHALEPFPQAYLIKSIFTDEPLIHIGIVDKASESEEWNEQTIGTMSVSDHWNREDGKNYNIYAFTNADEAELFVNGKSLGIRKNNREDIAQRNMILWQNVPYQKGELMAIAKNGGVIVARHTIETTGKPVALKIETENSEWKADGMDLQYVKVYAVDNEGRVVTTAVDEEVTFEVSGQSKLIAVDNGDHKSDELFAGNQRKLHNGFALAILRSTQTAGEVKIKASANGLKSAEKTLVTGNQRTKYNFNSDWLLNIGDMENAQNSRFDDKDWKQVTLPAAFNEDEAFRVSIAEQTDTIVWYRKHFRLPASAEGQKIFLEFEGIRFGGEFFLNGKSIGWSENGIMAFGFDITDLVNYTGDNVLAARIDNSWNYHEHTTGSTYQWNDRNFYANYGGIPKNVYLHVTPKIYQTLPLYSNLQTTGTYIYAREIDIPKRSAVIYAETQVRNEFPKEKTVELEVQLEDLDGKIIKTFHTEPSTIAAGDTKIITAGDKVTNLNFWSWGYGYLYNVYTILKIDGESVDFVKTRTGFRKTHFADGMFWLNDRVLQIKGYAERSTNEWPAVGQSVPAWLSDYSNKLLVESGGNTVRWMHVTPWKQDVESCDRVGLIQLMPAGDSEKDVEGRRWEQRVEVMRDAIIYNRNNPSIIFYEGGNKAISEEHIAELKAVRDKYDPYGGRAMGSREMLDSKIAEWGGEMLYINKSAHIPMFATEYCRDEALRWYWDELSYPYHKDGEGVRYDPSTNANTTQSNFEMRSYNRNQDSFFRELITRWWDYFRVRPGTGKRVSSGGLKIHFHEANSHWRGAENYRRSGVVDAMRIPKDAFFAHQVMWNGWVDNEKHGTYICGHWNYTNDIVKDVMVVSTGDKVELFVNGKSQGFGERSVGFLFTFPRIKWEAGTIEAVSYDENGKEISRAKKETVSAADHIALKLMIAPDGFKADGADLALVEVEVVDKEGRRCPLDNSMISFDLQGEGEWRGGIAHGGKKGNYVLEKTLPVESGVNRVLIRSTKKPGNITLKASLAGENIPLSTKLEGASITFNSIPFSEKDGLSTYISSDYQPVNLDRGETPAVPSFTIKRHSVDIIAATAGCNEEDVQKSFDDNELSEWKNDGRLATGWIKYELANEALVNEIELKLTGWRMRSYPIQVYVDDIKVFEGETEKSLGYISIPVKPTKGRFVTIKLIGQSGDNDAFGGIVEVAAPQAGELDLFKAKDGDKANNELRIVEVEVYDSL